MPKATPGTPPAPRVKAPPRVQHISTKEISANHQPIYQRLRSQLDPNQLEPATLTEKLVAHRTRFRTTQQALRVQPVLAAQRKYAVKLLNLWCTPRPEEHTAMSVLDNETGESLEYSQLCRHPKYKKVWNTYYFNALGRLFQGVGSGTSWEKEQRVKGTDTFQVITFENIPHDRWKEICHTSVVCEVRPNKDDPNHTHINVAGNCVSYPGDVATPTGSLELLNLIINSTLCRPGARFACFDIKTITWILLWTYHNMQGSNCQLFPKKLLINIIYLIVNITGGFILR